MGVCVCAARGGHAAYCWGHELIWCVSYASDLKPPIMTSHCFCVTSFEGYFLSYDKTRMKFNNKSHFAKHLLFLCQTCKHCWRVFYLTVTPKLFCLLCIVKGGNWDKDFRSMHLLWFVCLFRMSACTGPECRQMRRVKWSSSRLHSVQRNCACSQSASAVQERNGLSFVREILGPRRRYWCVTWIS